MFINILVVFASYSIVQVELEVGSDCGGCPDSNEHTNEAGMQPNLSDILNQTTNEGGNQPQIYLQNTYPLGPKVEGTSHGGIQPHLFLESSNAKAESTTQGEIQQQSNLLGNKLPDDAECKANPCVLGGGEPLETKSGAGQDTGLLVGSNEPSGAITPTQVELQPHSCSGSEVAQPQGQEPKASGASHDGSVFVGSSDSSGAVTEVPTKVQPANPIAAQPQPQESKTSGASQGSNGATTEVTTQAIQQPNSSSGSSNSTETANPVVTQQHLDNVIMPIKTNAGPKKKKPILFMKGAQPQGVTVGQAQENHIVLNQTEQSKNKKKTNLFSGKKKPKTEEENNWSYKYGANGPLHWADRNGSQCGGQRQSPINLEVGSFKAANNMSKLKWSKQYRMFPTCMTTVNNGRTIKLTVSFEADAKPTLEGGPLKTPYNLEEVHFHWGRSDQHGSEHAVNKKSFPMEIHVIHVASQFTNKTVAFKTDQGVAIVGYLVEIDKESNEAIGAILTVVDALKAQHDSPVKLNSVFKLEDLLDLFETDYLSYNGSFTTPPCYESVIWLVSPYTLSISHKQLEKFRQILSDNYRPLQPLNGRTVNFVHG